MENLHLLFGTRDDILNYLLKPIKNRRPVKYRLRICICLKNNNQYQSLPYSSKDVKILILLRNPADRAFSQYMWRVRDGRDHWLLKSHWSWNQTHAGWIQLWLFLYWQRFYARQVNIPTCIQICQNSFLEDLKLRPAEMLKFVSFWVWMKVLYFNRRMD